MVLTTNHSHLVEQVLLVFVVFNSTFSFDFPDILSLLLCLLSIIYLASRYLNKSI